MTPATTLAPGVATSFSAAPATAKVEPACYGVACPAHEHCARYHAAEGRPHETIPTCADAHGTRTLFMRVAEQARALA